MTIRVLLAITLTALAVPLVGAGGASAQKPPTTIAVFKDAGCGCCARWVEHLRKHGFTATTTDVANIDEVKAKHHVPQQAQSCHTAIVDGYVIEGHVPANDIQRLLKERPAIAGIAVPGMPVGSPGMEVEGMKADAYKVLAFDKDGKTRVFAEY